MTGSDLGPAGGGRVSLEGTVLRMVRTGTQVTVGDRLGEGWQGVVEAHPHVPGQVVLRNVGKKAWTMKPERGQPKRVDPSRRLAVRGMTIDFGGVRGRIVGS